MAALMLALAACASDGAADGDDAAAVPERPGETWYRVTLCTSVGPASIDMPGPVQVDGPRPLAHLPAPAEGTFAVSYGSTDDRRYDAFVIDDAGHLGSDDASVATGVLEPLNGEPEVVDLGEPSTVDQHVEVPYVETFNDRKMYSHALSARGVLYAFSVGLREGSAAEDRDIARSDLEHMRASVAFPGLDGEDAGPCTPSQEPIADGAGSDGVDAPAVEES